MSADDAVKASLDIAYQNAAANLAAVLANPKPSYSIDGQSVSWSDYVSMLNTQLATIRLNRVEAEGAWVLPVRMR